MHFNRKTNLDEIIDLYIKGEYDVPKVEVVSDNEYYFIDSSYFDIKEYK